MYNFLKICYSKLEVNYKMWIIFGIILIATVAYFSVKTYKEIKDAELLRAETVGNLEGALMMRYEVIEKLINYSSGRIKDENRFIIKLLEARLIPTLERIQVEKELVGNLKDLLFMIDGIPDLKCKKELTDYRLALAKAEKNIYDAKTFLNEKTRDYNRLLETFPKNIIAKFGKFQVKDYYEIDFVTR